MQIAQDERWTHLVTDDKTSQYNDDTCQLKGYSTKGT